MNIHNKKSILSDHHDEVANNRSGAFLILGIFSLMAVFLTILFKIVGVFPQSWPWGFVVGGLLVFLIAMFLLANFWGTLAVVLFFALSLPLGGFYLVFGIPLIQHAAEIQAQKFGQEGTAVVTATSFVGFLNYQSEFTLMLQVSPEEGSPFSTTTMVFGAGSSQNPPYPVGTKLSVKYLPQNHNVVILGPISTKRSAPSLKAATPAS
jgi:hypothetical protein